MLVAKLMRSKHDRGHAPSFYTNARPRPQKNGLDAMGGWLTLVRHIRRDSAKGVMSALCLREKSSQSESSAFIQCLMSGKYCSSVTDLAAATINLC